MEIAMKLLTVTIPSYNSQEYMRHAIESVLVGGEDIENIRYSSFLKGQNNKNWTITFDWLIKPNNFTKVLEGNYRDKGDSNNGGIEQNIKSSEDKPQYNFGCFE